MTLDEIESVVLQHIVHTVLHGDDRDFDSGTDLLATHVLDSMAAMELISYVSTAFSIDVPASEVTAANLRNVKSVAAMIHRLR